MHGRLSTALNSRCKEIGEALVAALRIMPWGHVVTLETVHLYIFFALDTCLLATPQLPPRASSPPTLLRRLEF
eukprot:2295585-Amphidinium_carterae.1